MEQEEFLKDVSWLNQLKLRFSYGATGNQSIDPYTTFSMYGQGSGESHMRMEQEIKRLQWW